MKVPTDLIADSCASRARGIAEKLRGSWSLDRLDLVDNEIGRLKQELTLLRDRLVEEDREDRLAAITERATRSHPRITP